MKKIYICMIALLLLMAGSIVNAGTITETGMSQRDLVRYLTNLKTMVNELKLDYNNFRAMVMANHGLTAVLGTTTTATATTDITLVNP
jgi:hypothetical protein